MINLDNNATTEALPSVIEAVCETLRLYPGNPSSHHALGAKARQALENARNQIALGLGASSPSEIIFTSSGTESINSAFALLLKEEVTQIIIPTTEHSAVLHATERWKGNRAIIQIAVDSNGDIDTKHLEQALQDRPSLVSISLANNETGIITETSAISDLCKKHNALLHIDAVQAAGKTPIQLESLRCNAASFSAHKFHGAPGCGILYIQSSSQARLSNNAILPGTQEHGFRGGTQNLASIVGTATAVESFNESFHPWSSIRSLHSKFEEGLLEVISGSMIHGINSCRLPNTTSLYCPNRNAADLVASLSQNGIAVSAGAACSNGGSPSHVIQAMGFTKEQANSTIRISLSKFTTESELDEAAKQIIKTYYSTLPTSICD